MKTAFVTGGSRGIGAAVSRLLGASGYRVRVGYNAHPAEAAAVADAIRAAGGDAEPVRCDVSDRASVFAAISGELDLLVANAGVAWSGLLQDMPPDAVDRLLEVDLRGVIYACQAALPGMLRAHRGAIVTVSSIWGIRGASCEAVYSAAKAGVIGFTKALAQEVGPSGITVNCVAPGVVDTEMNAALTPADRAALADETPLGRLGTPDEIASAVLYLAEASFVTGQVLSINGGLVV